MVCTSTDMTEFRRAQHDREELVALEQMARAHAETANRTLRTSF
jgi:hypothetical protein